MMFPPDSSPRGGGAAMGKVGTLITTQPWWGQLYQAVAVYTI